MRHVIIRDDDTNAFTPVAALERLYRPFLKRNLPVNLAVIPKVSTRATSPDGKREGFLTYAGETGETHRAMDENRELVDYLCANRGFHVLQHGFEHSCFEFGSEDLSDIKRRLDEGTRLLMKAGFAHPTTFVGPHDRFSKVSLTETARRFPVISSGWYELKRLPQAWWPNYLMKKVTKSPHWKVGRTQLLTHPGCLLSYNHPYETMLDRIKASVAERPLTVLVTHWWEYFRDGKPDEAFINVLHQTAEWLANDSGIKVISFDDLAAKS